MHKNFINKFIVGNNKDFVFLFGCVFLVLASYFCDIINLTVLSFLFNSTALILILKKLSESNLFHIMWGIALVIFGFMPPILLLLAGENAELWLLRTLVLATVFVVMATRECDYKGFNKSRWHISIQSAWYFCIFAFLVMIITSGLSFLFLSPVIIFVTAKAIGRAGKMSFFIFIATYILYFIFYIVFYWDGFGRLILAAMLIPMYFIVAHERNWRFSKYFVILSALFIGMLASLNRLKNANSLVHAIMNDSTVLPYILAIDIEKSTNLEMINLSGWLDQVLLFFFASFPRDLWPAKPLGFGRQYVIDELDIAFLDNGYSIASLFVGEHIYYLGYFWIFGVFLTLFGLVSIFKYFHKLDNNSGIWGVMVCLWVPTYFWGGIASFSSRFQIGLMVTIMIIFLRFLVVRRRKLNLSLN